MQFQNLISRLVGLNVQYQLMRADFRLHFLKAFPKAVNYTEEDVKESLILSIRKAHPEAVLMAYVTTTGNTIFLVDGEPLESKF